ncbi:tetratricopeptide repeat protein [Microscilla marina]|uniref:Tetratricopeptide repeat domain protein n=1 Tax=Microscilla marina ATCC 23134 TaxID=313606 RepID=A1ZLK6_MICM2|nr:tetratricopeptide repeat protein [Microscilla marina]EAY28760.1 tetratricopeptide repeat domain protein [Microscilla marina ATCC 23134]
MAGNKRPNRKGKPSTNKGKKELHTQEGDTTTQIFENLESADTLQERLLGTETFLKRNQRIITIALGVLVVAVAGYFVMNYLQGEKERKAQEEIFFAQRYYEIDSLNRVVNGFGTRPGAKAINEDYSGTKAGNLAAFYTGVAYLKQGKFQEAINYLEEFSTSDLLVQARAYSLVADAYQELKQYDKAILNYKKAIDHEPNKFFTPPYLMKLALVYELQNKPKAAIATYERLLKDYPNASDANNAKKYKGKLLAQKK